MTRVRPSTWFIWYLSLRHLIWGVTLVSSNAPLSITAIATMTRLGITSNEGAAFLYLLLATAAGLGLGAPHRVAARIFLIPQHLAVLISAYGALYAMYTGAFADGTIRTQAFLIADQLPYVLIVPFYALAVYMSFYHSSSVSLDSTPNGAKLDRC